MLLFALHAAVAAPADRYGRADRDASCGLVTVEAVVELEDQADSAFDSFYGELLPYAALMPVPTECRDRLSVFVESLWSTDVRVCARVTSGPGIGRSFCSGLDSRVVEVLEGSFADSVEPGATRIVPTELSGFDAAAALPRVAIGAVDGRVIAILDDGQVAACARDLLGDLVVSEVAYDAAFDGYSADLGAIGFRLDGSGSCSAYVGVRVAGTDWPASFEVQAVVLSGGLRGRVYVSGPPGDVVDGGAISTNRARLAAEGWTLDTPVGP